MSTSAARRRRPDTRAGVRHVEWVGERLSARDWAILTDLDRLRVLSADQLERLHFSSLTNRSREVVRGRVLQRLAAWRVITSMGRRIGGSQRGSSRAIWTLDSVGQRLIEQRRAAVHPAARVRRPRQPGERFLAHALAVSELYVSLATTQSGAVLAAFDAEPAAWWPNGLNGWLKPDAYLRLSMSTWDDHWWAECDRATESLPTLRRKLETYLDFYQRGQLGPHGVMPRVLVSTITEQRREAVRDLVASLPEPANALFVATLDRDALPVLLGSLKE